MAFRTLPHLRRAHVLALAAGAAALPAFATDFDTVAQRVTNNLLSSPPSTSSVQNDMNTLQADGSWSDINYASTAQTNWVPLTHLNRMSDMATLWGDPNSSLYHNATLATDLQHALDYWFSFTANASGAPSSADNYNNPTPYSTNWFDNTIAGPQALGEVLVMSTPVFTPTELSTAQYYLLNAKKEISKRTGQNIVDLAIASVYSSISSGNTSDMTSAFNSMGGTIFIADFGTDGIQADHTYHIHNIQLYMGGYGTSYVNDILHWGGVSAGTQFAFTDTQIHNVVDYLLDGTQWFIRGKTLELTADGRQVTFPSYVGAGDNFVNAINDALSLGNYRTAELQAFLARQQDTIAHGQASTTQFVLSGNRMFWDSEAMVQQRAAYYASVKVTSTRISQPETGNNQGLENLYLGDGVNLIQITGNEYLGIQPSWNWRRLPGTTVEQDSRSLTPPGTFGATHGTTDYAGGVSDNTYGATAFNYNRFNVAAKKSWFFFDNEQVALGAAINAPNSVAEVDTILNQTLTSGTVSYKTSGGSVQTLALGSTVTPANLQWVFHNGIGYFFITPVSNATIMNVAQSGAWSTLNTAASSTVVTQNIFTLYLNHGTAFTNGSYAYIAVPGITLANMDAYLASLPIQILKNDSTGQVVRNTTLDLTEAAFYAAGNVTIAGNQSIATNNPATFMLQRQANFLKLSASSPQAAALTENLTLTSINLSGSSTWFDAFGNAVATFNLVSGNYGGATSGLTLVNDNAPAPTVTLTSNDQRTNNTYKVTAPVVLTANTTLNNDAFSTLNLSAQVSGNFNLTKSGAGTLLLSTTNAFTGGLTINAGTARELTPGAAGTGAITVNTSGTLVLASAGTFTNAITLAGGTLGVTSAPTDIASAGLTAAPNTTSFIQIADPQSPTTSSDVILLGTLHGSGNITILPASNTANPDGGNGFRLRGAAASDFSGVLTLANNVKAELQTSTTSPFSPAGTGTIVLTAGDHTSGGNNTVTTTNGYTELNLRNNSTGNAILNNNFIVVGTGITLLNMLGSAPANTTVTLGNLTMSDGQTLGIFLNSGNAHTAIFQNANLTGGNITVAPKPQNWGTAGAVGSDLILGNISESAPSSLIMAGLRTLTLTGNNTFSLGLNIQSGTVLLANANALGTGPLAIHTGAFAQIQPNLASALVTPSLTLDGTTNNWSAKLDITNNKLVINASANRAATIATLKNQITFATSHTTGITSSTLDAQHAIGLADNANLHFASFANRTVDANSVLIATTFVGDANLDGKVDINDLTLIANHWQSNQTDWSGGDLDYSGFVDINDLTAVANHWQMGVTPGFSGATSFAQALTQFTQFDGVTVPEPASLTFLLAASIVFKRRRP